MSNPAPAPQAPPDVLPTPKADNRPASTEKISLLVPIKVGDKEVSELTLRRPRVSDHLAIQGRTDITDAQKEVTLFGLLTGLAPNELQQLDMADYGQLQEQYKVFVDARPAKLSAVKSSS